MAKEDTCFSSGALDIRDFTALAPYGACSFSRSQFTEHVCLLLRCYKEDLKSCVEIRHLNDSTKPVFGFEAILAVKWQVWQIVSNLSV